MFPKMLAYHLLTRHIGCEKLAYHQRHLNFIFISWIVCFGTLFDDISILAEEVVIIRKVKALGSPTPYVVPDQFIVPQPYCFNGVPNCQQFDAVAVKTANESCACKCDINHNKTTFSYLNNSWACRSDHKLQSLSGSGCLLRFESNKERTGVSTFSGGKWDYFLNLDYKRNRCCKVQETKSKILNCDGNWQPLSSQLTKIEVMNDTKLSKYYLQAVKTDLRYYREIRGQVVRIGITCEDSTKSSQVNNYCVLIKFEGSTNCTISTEQPTDTTFESSKTTLITESSSVAITSGSEQRPTALGTVKLLTPSQAPSEDKGGWFLFAVIISAFAGILVILFIVIVVVLLWMRKKKRKQSNNREAEVEPNYESPDNFIQVDRDYEKPQWPVPPLYHVLEAPNALDQLNVKETKCVSNTSDESESHPVDQAHWYCSAGEMLADEQEVYSTVSDIKRTE